MSAALREELEAVEAILMEGIEVDEDDEWTRVRVQLHPLTASDDDKKYVSMTLEMTFPKEYPDKEPKIQIRNPRGLDDAGLAELLSSLSDKCQQFLGNPVVFELIDQGREFLTESNVPACPCAICLHAIADDDVFHRTTCYHYFHSNCLGRYAQVATADHADFLRENPAVPGSSEDRELVITCPVCREPMRDVKQEVWLRAPPPKQGEEDEEVAKLTPELLQLQKKMRALYLRQKAKGSIIDVEAEDKKFLVLTRHSEDLTASSQVVQEDDQQSGAVKAEERVEVRGAGAATREADKDKGGHERRRGGGRGRHKHHHPRRHHEHGGGSSKRGQGGGSRGATSGKAAGGEGI